MTSAWVDACIQVCTVCQGNSLGMCLSSIIFLALYTQGVAESRTRFGGNLLAALFSFYSSCTQAVAAASQQLQAAISLKLVASVAA